MFCTTVIHRFASVVLNINMVNNFAEISALQRVQIFLHFPFGFSSPSLPVSFELQYYQ